MINISYIPIKLLFIVLIAILVVFITIPIWSDSKKVCEYWEKKNNEMVCIQETTYYCLGKC